MKKNQWVVVGLAALMMVVLAACVRSLAPADSADSLPTATVGEGAPVATSDIMKQLEMFATQTMMASMGITGTLPIAEPVGTVVPAPDQAAAAGQPTAEGQPVDAAQPTAESQPPAAAVEPPAEPVAVPTVETPSSYTLHTGEHVYCIARRFDVNPADLLNANGLSTGSVLYAGMDLKIPAGSSFPGARSLIKHPTTHTVAAGETVYSIACQYGDVTPEAIAFVNNMTPPYKLQAGQQISIP